MALRHTVCRGPLVSVAGERSHHLEQQRGHISLRLGALKLSSLGLPRKQVRAVPGIGALNADGPRPAPYQCG
jgi:hypothetical protein